MKFKKVYDGEKAVLINRNGEISELNGPKLVFLAFSKLEKLKRYFASDNQYLIIKHSNGQIEHKPGPTNEWYNRFEHESIQIKDSYKLDDSQKIIVYERESSSNLVKRRIVSGPCVFVPKSTEWLHQFKWHGEDKDQIGHMNQDANKFEILTQKPDFFHYYVKEVRTLDDSLITVKIMIIFELINIEQMLDKTQDPISDFINAICADVISMVSKMTFAEFLDQSTKILNNLDYYEQLKQRSSRNGFKIESIIYNGYSSSQALQDMQDNSIQSRTQMRINAEIDKQKNELINLRLASENKRFELENQLIKLKFEFEQKLLDKKIKFDLESKQLENDLNLKLKEIENNAMYDLDEKLIKINEIYLENLKNLKVDVNQYQIKLNNSKNKVDRIYELI